MPDDVHALMQYADDLDAIMSLDVEQDMRADSKSAMARFDVIAGGAHVGRHNQMFDRLLDAV